MYSYHAWIELYPKDDTQEAEEKFQADLTTLKAMAQERLELNGRQAVFGIQTMSLFQCAEHHSRPLDRHERLLEVLHWISREMAGSCGLVYWRDDDQVDEAAANRYNVLVLRKGMVEEREDPFLSPCYPMVEWELDQEGHTIG